MSFNKWLENMGQMQVPMQQAPMQQVPMQQAPMQQAPIQQAPMQQLNQRQLAVAQTLAQAAGSQADPMHLYTQFKGTEGMFQEMIKPNMWTRVISTPHGQRMLGLVSDAVKMQMLKDYFLRISRG